MYSKNEIPIIGATIFYYDNQYDITTSKAVLSILEKYNYFPPKKIFAGKLTKGRLILSNNETSDIFIQAYAEKNVPGIELVSEKSKIEFDYWRVLWNFTFFKNSHMAVASPKFMPWNILAINSTYGRLQDAQNYLDYILCVKELIQTLNPFYASIDDVANRVALLDRAHEKTFVPDRIQQIFWGNYFGEDFCKQYGSECIAKIPAKSIEPVGNGYLFFLSDNVLDFSSVECEDNRKRIRKHLCKLH